MRFGLDKSSRLDIALKEQQRSWDEWHRTHPRDQKPRLVSERQSAVILEWCTSLGRNDMEIIDIGCGLGWMSERLLPFGKVTGVDLADEAIKQARKRAPQIKFISGDLFNLDLPEGFFDIVVSLEVLSHVRDQPAFLSRVAGLLKPGGHFMLATQNRYVLERWDVIRGAIPGQIRHWVNARELRRLLAKEFELIELTSVLPVGDGGLLRIVNSAKLNYFFTHLFGRDAVERAKERLLLGHALLALTRKRETRYASSLS
jgi:2-polyprenyl-3-methyl-5-hydroxy-6-metoxy-1,4-benzoquinol methylase